MRYFKGMILALCVGCRWLPESYAVIESSAGNNTTDENDENRQYSPYTFEGIISVEKITDSTAMVHWISHSQAIRYDIYQVTDEVSLIASFTSPASSGMLTGLESEHTYKLRVNLIDSSGLIDANVNDLEFRTLGAPVAPRAMSLIYPGYSPSVMSEVVIRVKGTKKGDAVKLFSDSECQNNVSYSIASSDEVDLNVFNLLEGEHVFYSQSIGIHDNASACSSVSINYHKQVCPTGYVPIPKNENFTSFDFCIMKFEAKAFNNGTGQLQEIGCGESACSTLNWAPLYHSDSNPNGYKPTSVADGKPWRRISQVQSKQGCQNLGVGFDLINNVEWMTIAHNIERKSENWSSAVVGTGFINRGHSDQSPNEPCDATLDNVEDDCHTQGFDWHQKRTHHISNGETVWDLAGNVRQWIDWNIDADRKAYITADDGPVAAFREWNELQRDATNTLLTDPMAQWTWSPFNKDLSSEHHIGKYFAGTAGTGGAAHRGGSWLTGLASGIYDLRIHLADNVGWNYSGFRCVYRFDY
jgi:hypothetical protein